jgi:cation diffusion facilitator CzcD-associated flavoprotein CzcO
MKEPLIRNIAIVGAGFAGLVSAKVFRDFGWAVKVFEKDVEVGGVWSSSRRYPGLTTQNVRSTYALSDFPYPKNYPEWPSGEQVQKYLADYVAHFGLANDINLNTTVESTTFDEVSQSWMVVTSDSQGSHEEEFDFLVVANGIFSDPLVPEFEGQEAFLAAGGTIQHTCDFHSVDQVAGKDVVVIGFGKSSCDVAAATVGTSKSTTIVARKIIWKIPKKFKNVLNYKMLLLTRMGEALFPYVELKGFEKFLHGKGKAVSAGMLGSVQSVVTSQFKLNDIELHPNTGLDTIVRSTVSLASDNFFKYVQEGKLVVERDTEIVKLDPGMATLKNGKQIPAEAIICGTGFYQRVPFFSPELMESVTDAKDNFRLYRQILPIGVPRLAFNGYNSSFYSQLNAEVGAWWISAYLSGMLDLPSDVEQIAFTEKRLEWMEERTEGKHSRGTNIIPFSVHNVDELLSDLNIHISGFKRFQEWLLPIDPRNYASIEGKLIKRRDKQLTAAAK